MLVPMVQRLRLGPRDESSGIITCKGYGRWICGVSCGSTGGAALLPNIFPAFVMVLILELFLSSGGGISDAGNEICCAMLGDKIPKLIRESISNSASGRGVGNADRPSC